VAELLNQQIMKINEQSNAAAELEHPILETITG
jgi:hypothetical protein